MENLCFTYKSPQMEAAYTVFNRQTHHENLFTLIFFAIWSLISTDIPAIIDQNFRDLGIALGVCLLLIIITFWKKIPKELSQCLTPIIVFLFNMTGFYLTTNQYENVAKPIMFFRGYGFASIQVLLYIHCRDFQKKVMVIMATFIIRYSIMINLDSDTIKPETILRQISVDIFAICTFYTQERRQRKIFQDYYKSNHQVSQLTDLVHDFMPSSLAILNTKLDKILFSNKAFAQNFNTQEPASPVSATNHTLLAFGETSLTKLMRLKIDKFTSRAPVLLTSRHVKPESLYLDKFLQNLQEKEEFYEKGFSCSFIASSNLSPDHQKKTFEVKITPIEWQNSQALAFILTDITVQDTLMTCKVANDKKDAVVATVSHELRTPLNGIIGMLDLVEKKIEDPEVMEYIDLCKDNSRLLLSLVNSILDMEQIKQKKLKLNPARVSLQKLLESVLQLFHFQCSHKNLSLALEIDENCPIYLFTDENRLKQILINLIGNALKFTFAGGITIHASPNKEKPEYLTISVSDTGIGIKEEDRVNLFKKFGRLEDGEGVNQNGVGLGLVISNSLARLLSKKEKYEAGITVESQYGQGSKFSFEILIACPCEASPVLKTGKKHFNFDEITLKLSDDHSSDDIDVGIEVLPGLSSNKISTKIASHVLSSPNRNMNFTSINQCSTSQEELFLVGRTPRRDFTQTILSGGRRYSSPHRSSFHLKKLQEKSVQYIVDQANQMSLLVVDDNPFNLLVAQGIIEELGYGCVTAKSGEEAIDLFKTSKSETFNFKAILMDCQMPGMDGFETTKALLEMMEEKGQKKLPIIALTANSHEEDIKKCYECGMVDVIQKPMSSLSLVKSLKGVKE